LIPDYLQQFPQDPMDLKPLRYRVTTSGYDLWSIGLDRRDDGGKALPPETVLHDQPDWVFHR